MKKYLFLIVVGLLSLTVLFNSCEKDEDENVPQPIATGQTGTLTIYLINSSTNLPDTGSSISLYYDYSYNNDMGMQPLNTIKTDAQGKVNFGELNYGNYWVGVNWAYQVQVIAGRENIYTIKY